MRSDYAQRMMFHGIVVFLLGLLSGLLLFFGGMRNPQVGMITHLEGVLNGIFLVVLGLIWHRMRLGPAAERVLMILGIACVYLNFLQALWGGAMGRSRPTTVFPQDRLPYPGEAFILDFVLPGFSMGFLVVCAMILWGLHRGMAEQRLAASAGSAARGGR